MLQVMTQAHTNFRVPGKKTS